MPKDGLVKGAGSPIVQIGLTPTYSGGKTNAPQRRGTPLATAGMGLLQSGGQARAHVMQQQISVGVNGLISEFRMGMIRSGAKRIDMAVEAPRRIEQCFSAQCESWPHCYGAPPRC